MFGWSSDVWFFLMMLAFALSLPARARAIERRHPDAVVTPAYRCWVTGLVYGAWGFVSLLGAFTFGDHLPLIADILLVALGFGLWLVTIRFWLEARRLHRQAIGQLGSERRDNLR